MSTEEAYKRAGIVSRSFWWLVANKDGDSLEVLTLDGGGTLPVFSGEGEAELFSWLKEAREHGWEIRESSPGELVSALCGPCSRVRLVALDPSMEVLGGEAAELLGWSREDFLAWTVSGSRRP